MHHNAVFRGLSVFKRGPANITNRVYVVSAQWALDLGPWTLGQWQ